MYWRCGPESEPNRSSSSAGAEPTPAADRGKTGEKLGTATYLRKQKQVTVPRGKKVYACPIGGTFFDELCLIMNSYIVLRIAYRVKG
jgi:hypothetical protein